MGAEKQRLRGDTSRVANSGAPHKISRKWSQIGKLTVESEERGSPRTDILYLT